MSSTLAALLGGEPGAFGVLTSQGGQVQKIYASAEINALAVGPTQVVPAVPGKAFVCTRLMFINTATAAGPVLTPGTMKGGTDASHTNMLAATTNILNATQFNLGVPAQLGSNTLQALMVVNAPLIVEVTIAPTGGVGFAFKLRVYAEGFFI